MITDDTATFTLSIEPREGKAFLHGFHLGTIESVARDCAEYIFQARNQNGQQIRTVALIRNRKLFDCFDGCWSSEYGLDD